MDEMIGRVDRLDARAAVKHWKAKGLDLSPILIAPEGPGSDARRCTVSQDHGLALALDNKLIAAAAPALEEQRPVELRFPIRNVNRTVGTDARRRGLTAVWGSGSGGRHDSSALQWFGGPELRGLRAPRHDADPRRRRE
jgi:hypothetical protein